MKTITSTTILILATICLIGLSVNCFAAENSPSSGTYENTYRKLYKNDYHEFWRTVWTMKDEAFKCKKIDAVVDFLGANYQMKGNAEVDEFFGEQVEGLFLRNPECLLRSLQKVQNDQREFIVSNLSSPIFESQERISEIFQNYKNNQNYNDIIDLYFSIRANK